MIPAPFQTPTRRVPLWRNGRRGRLKICCLHGRAGSSPARGTSNPASLAANKGQRQSLLLAPSSRSSFSDFLASLSILHNRQFRRRGDGATDRASTAQGNRGEFDRAISHGDRYGARPAISNWRRKRHLQYLDLLGGNSERFPRQIA